MTRVIAVANQKGGVGKTTTAVNLSSCVAALDRAVLVVDMDPQANATSAFGLKQPGDGKPSVYESIIGGLPLRELLRPTELEQLKVVPSNRRLTGAEIELVGVSGHEFKLRDLLAPVRGDFDYVFVDCPPSLGLLTLNALGAADSVLIPLQAEYFALEGVSDLMNTIRFIQTKLNPRLTLEGVVLTMFDERTNLARQIREDIEAYFRGKLFRTVIPRNVRLGEAPSFGKPILLYDINSRGAQAYLALAKELIAHETTGARKGS
jgi:chromosome partitioning protein